MLIFRKCNFAEEKLRNLHIDDPLLLTRKVSKCFWDQKGNSYGAEFGNASKANQSLNSPCNQWEDTSRNIKQPIQKQLQDKAKNETTRTCQDQIVSNQNHLAKLNKDKRKSSVRCAGGE